MRVDSVVVEGVQSLATALSAPVESKILFASASFVGVLVCMQPGARVPLHVHEHKDEAFDVVQGRGVFTIAGQEISLGEGAHVFVPAMTQHSLHNSSETIWLLRETVHERVYARTAIKLVALALLKRLPLVGGRWRAWDKV